MATAEEIAKAIRGFVVEEVLEGKDVGLDNQTPLLEWGVLNSLEMVRLTDFILERFGIKVPNEQINPSNFQNLDAITALVNGLQPSPVN